METARANGFADDYLHLEYFAVPETPDYENHSFTLQLNDRREIAVAADTNAADALIAAGVHVDLKCQKQIRITTSSYAKVVRKTPMD